MGAKIQVIPNLILIPRRELVRAGNRWIIYLPTNYNEIWAAIKAQGKRVKIYLEIVE